MPAATSRFRNLCQILHRRSDTSQMRHGFGAAVALDTADQVDGSVAGGPASPIGYGNVSRLQWSQIADRALELLHRLIALRRKELERKDGLSPRKNVTNPHKDVFSVYRQLADNIAEIRSGSLGTTTGRLPNVA